MFLQNITCVYIYIYICVCAYYFFRDVTEKESALLIGVCIFIKIKNIFKIIFFIFKEII